MNPLENHCLMRFTVVVSQENLTSNADTLIHTALRLNFVSKKSLNVICFYIYCKVAPKLVVGVANEERISTDNISCPTFCTIDKHEFRGYTSL
jgi:hypothetical protein